MLDASVFVAAISPAEIHHLEARLLLDDLPERQSYLVPSIFRLEVLAALARRGESDEVLETADALVSGPRFHVHALGVSLVESAVAVARRARLRAYDAIYAALALVEGARLITLDRDVVERLRISFPDLLADSHDTLRAGPSRTAGSARRRRAQKP